MLIHSYKIHDEKIISYDFLLHLPITRNMPEPLYTPQQENINAYTDHYSDFPPYLFTFEFCIRCLTSGTSACR